MSSVETTVTTGLSSVTSALAKIEALSSEAVALPDVVGKINELVGHANDVVDVLGELEATVKKVVTSGETLGEDVISDVKAAVAKVNSFFHPHTAAVTATSAG